VAGLIIVGQRGGQEPRSRADIQRCAELIVPDNIVAPSPLVWEQDGVVTAAVNPGPQTLSHEGSVAVGHLYESPERWWEQGPVVPDGSYALCRVGDRSIELVTDLYASRTLWYVQTDDRFLASSSQRALVALLGDFQPNPEAVSWMLSAGYLPPEAGWDVRLHRLPPACRLTLDRRLWSLDQASHAIPVSPLEGTEREHIDHLRRAVLDACARLDLPWETWCLALSGGMNSRSILVGLARVGKRPTCVTWGRAAARRDPRNDAAIGPRLADRFGLPHSFLATDFTGEPLDRVLGRFVAVSEGCLDHFGGYTDGLAMWKLLVEAGVNGVVRGDEPTQGYQWKYPSETLSRLHAQAHLVDDYPPAHAIHRLGLAPQTWPESLRRRPEESLSAYSGRLFAEFWSPAMASPLNDVKGIYLEVANPLLSREVVAASHGLPESLHRGRRAMTAVLSSMNVELPFAQRSAPIGRPSWFAHPGFCEEVRRGLSLPAAERLFSEEALTALATSLRERPAASLWAGMRPRVKEVVPGWAVARLKPRPHLTATGGTLAFRAYIAVRTMELLTADAVVCAGRQTVAISTGRDMLAP
jgi:hypothetical protein